ncbi:MAG: RHS repeat-associated core domain-containing protein, partial [Bacteroidota bacterium]
MKSYYLFLGLLMGLIQWGEAEAQQRTERLNICPQTIATTYTDRDSFVPVSNSNLIATCNTLLGVSLENDDQFPDFPDTGVPFKQDGMGVAIVNGDQRNVFLNLKWREEYRGTVTVSVYYQKQKPKTGGLGGCKTDGPRVHMVDYVITRDTINPGGRLITDANTLSSSDGKETITLTYEPSPAYSQVIKTVKYFLTYHGGERVPVGFIPFENNNGRLRIFTTGFGDYLIESSIVDGCGYEFTSGPSALVSVIPSCIEDTNPFLSVTGPRLETYAEGFQVQERGAVHQVHPNGITDFNDLYELKHDGGPDFNLYQEADQWKFTLTNPFSSTTITPVADTMVVNRCITPGPIKVFSGGRDITLSLDCPVTVPQDLYTQFGYTDEADPDGLVRKHFAATLKSQRQIVITPGIELTEGAELILEYTPAPVKSDADSLLHFTETLSYDDFGRVIAESRTYTDGQGRLMQQLRKNLTEGVVLGSAVKYDEYNRPILHTSVAPTEALPRPAALDTCDLVNFPSSFLSFQYADRFVYGASEDGTAYANVVSSEFGAETDVSQEENAVGWYYSAANTYEGVSAKNEQGVAFTDYPYTQTRYHPDGEVKSTTVPGDAYRLDGGHVPTQEKQVVSGNDPYLRAYLDSYEQALALQPIRDREGNFYSRTYRDADGKTARVYYDRADQAVIALDFGTQNTPLTTSYTFYDLLGRVVCEVSPNGVAQLQRNVPFETIDRTTYEYNSKGELVAVNEPDAGRSEYVYRRDGQVRFSQNALQRSKGSYSYTHYDALARPVASGEYTPNANGIRFNSADMRNIIEAVTTDGGLAATDGDRSDWNRLFYDLPHDNPLNREQAFVVGRVSYTQSEVEPYPHGDSPTVLTTWFSYDERGRLEWEIKEIPGLGVKTVDYAYDPNGGIRSIAFEKDNSAEAFYHYYAYDVDARISKVYTGKTAPRYDREGNMANIADFELQATYDYYLHGPQKRMEFGEGVQGMDYRYTAANRLKAINATATESDPGRDGLDNTNRPDLFGQVLDYYAGDYRSNDPEFTAVSGLAGVDQFGGNLKAQTWHNANDPETAGGYAYHYDDRNQLTRATYGNLVNGQFTVASDRAYQVGIGGYDANGNLANLKRKGSVGQDIADYTYAYAVNGNRLDSVQNAAGDNLYYGFDEIGELVYSKEGTEERYYQYDVGQLLTGVFRDSSHTQPVVTFAYDELGNRLSKVTYDSVSNPLWQTWYVSDVSGMLMGIYAQNLQTEDSEPLLVELPVYGGARIGHYKPVEDLTYYELKDHQGNIRATVGWTNEVTYTATMESEHQAKETAYFSGLRSTVVAKHLNHTEEDPAIHANEAMRINNVLDASPNPVGGGITLAVYPSDTVSTRIQVKYEGFDRSTHQVVPLLADYLSATFSKAIPLEGTANAFAQVNDPAFLGLASVGALDDQQPRIYLNYLLFSNDFELLDHGFDQVSEAARVPHGEGTTGKSLTDHPFEELALEIPVSQAGFLYVYFSNENTAGRSGQSSGVTAYFDDFLVTHHLSDVVYAADYYPFGLPMEGSKVEKVISRYGYQGEFAEKDKETGFDSFYLRQYDARIGRWTSMDPYAQYWSGYVGMGNAPHMGIDPDGGLFGLGQVASAAVGAGIGFGLAGGVAALSGAGDDWWKYGLAGAAVGGTLGYFSAETTRTLGNPNLRSTLGNNARKVPFGKLKFPSFKGDLSKAFNLFDATKMGGIGNELLSISLSHSFSIGKLFQHFNFQFDAQAPFFNFDLFG